jgi:cystathionine gamma-lyase
MTASTPRPGFSTRAIHAGQEADPATGAVITPIYAASTSTAGSCASGDAVR